MPTRLPTCRTQRRHPHPYPHPQMVKRASFDASGNVIHPPMPIHKQIAWHEAQIKWNESLGQNNVLAAKSIAYHREKIALLQVKAQEAG